MHSISTQEEWSRLLSDQKKWKKEQPNNGSIAPEFLEETRHFLASESALESIERDCYWPKWESPWWRLTLLLEIDQLDWVPPSFLEAFQKALQKQYLTYFPLREEELPAGKNARHIYCHCALGTIYQIFAKCGKNVEEEFPWMASWFSQYQLPDGGWNCDEAVYLRKNPKSSFVSSLPILEVLNQRVSAGKTAESEILDRGAHYLITRHLCRSLSKQFEIADPLWLVPIFPRFYRYDILRGLSFLAKWALVHQKELPTKSLLEGFQALVRLQGEDGILQVPKTESLEKTLRWSNGDWTRGHPVGTFPLLEKVREGANFYLTKEFWTLCENLEQLERKQLLK